MEATRFGKRVILLRFPSTLTFEELDELTQSLEPIARENPDPLHICADFRPTGVIPQGVVDRLLELMTEGTESGRTALVANDNPILRMQLSRMMRTAGGARETSVDRKVFDDAAEAATWLSELLDDKEADAVKSFLENTED